MAKFIPALIAIFALTANISAYAVTSEGTLTQPTRNEIQTLGESTDDGLSYKDKDSLPAFRAGDVLQFDISELTASKELILISHKYNADLSDSTVQYLNQYTIDAASMTINYKIRDIEDGIYKIVLNGNDGLNIANFYYKVGNPTISIVKGNDDTTDYYLSKEYDGTYSVAFVAKVTMDTADVTLQDTGIETVGLEFNLKDASGKKVYKDLSSTQISNLLYGDEIGGTVSFYYGLTMYKIPAEDLDKIIATPRLDGVAVSAE